jgi:hypothetical protein
VPPPSRQHVKPDSERLFQQLHYQRQLKPIAGLNGERRASFLNDKPAYPEAVTPFRLAEYAVEERFGPRKLEKRFADINRRLYFVPSVFGQLTFRSHIVCLRIYMRLLAHLLYFDAKKG